MSVSWTRTFSLSRKGASTAKNAKSTPSGIQTEQLNTSSESVPTIPSVSSTTLTPGELFDETTPTGPNLALTILPKRMTSRARPNTPTASTTPAPITISTPSQRKKPKFSLSSMFRRRPKSIVPLPAVSQFLLAPVPEFPSLLDAEAHSELQEIGWSYAKEIALKEALKQEQEAKLEELRRKEEEKRTEEWMEYQRDIQRRIHERTPSRAPSRASRRSSEWFGKKEGRERQGQRKMTCWEVSQMLEMGVGPEREVRAEVVRDMSRGQDQLIRDKIPEELELDEGNSVPGVSRLETSAGEPSVTVQGVATPAPE